MQQSDEEVSSASPSSTTIADIDDGNNTSLINGAGACADSQESKKKKKNSVRFRKAPQAPKRGKSAFIFFSIAKHAEARKATQDVKNREKVPEIASRISEQWRNMLPHDRAYWKDMSAADKKRYEMEKSMYTGPWKLPAGNKRAKKDPNAPKRPMSAFLDYSKKMRGKVKMDNPGMININVSKVLAEMWKNAPEHERAVHIEKEAKERAVYKVATAEWRKKRDDDLAEERECREKYARDAVNYYEQQPDAVNYLNDHASFHSQHYGRDITNGHRNDDYHNGTSNPTMNNNMMQQNPHAVYYDRTEYFNAGELEGAAMPSRNNGTCSVTGVNLAPESIPYISSARQAATNNTHVGRQRMTNGINYGRQGMIHEMQQPYMEEINITQRQMMIHENSGGRKDLVHNYTTQQRGMEGSNMFSVNQAQLQGNVNHVQQAFKSKTYHNQHHYIDNKNRQW